MNTGFYHKLELQGGVVMQDYAEKLDPEYIYDYVEYWDHCVIECSNPCLCPCCSKPVPANTRHECNNPRPQSGDAE